MTNKNDLTISIFDFSKLNGFPYSIEESKDREFENSEKFNESLPDFLKIFSGPSPGRDILIK